jgi:hypothetical protein
MSHFGGTFEVNFGMAASEPHSKVWILDTNSLSALELSKNTNPKLSLLTVHQATQNNESRNAYAT